MKLYHLTILRNDRTRTIYTEVRSLAAFLKAEREQGRNTHILYSREIDKEEFWEAISYDL